MEWLTRLVDLERRNLLFLFHLGFDCRQNDLLAHSHPSLTWWWTGWGHLMKQKFWGSPLHLFGPSCCRCSYNDSSSDSWGRIPPPLAALGPSLPCCLLWSEGTLVGQQKCQGLPSDNSVRCPLIFRKSGTTFLHSCYQCHLRRGACICTVMYESFHWSLTAHLMAPEHHFLLTWPHLIIPRVGGSILSGAELILLRETEWLGLKTQLTSYLWSS